MADPKGFMNYTRELPEKRTPQERIHDYKEIYKPFSEDKIQQQADRCMDCGTPFCHSGCPLGNIIPEFNEAVANEDWSLAYTILDKTNNFPEFTGRICPAPCEGSCVLGINQPPVAIELIEKSIIEHAFEAGMVKPRPPKNRSGKKVAVVGSGPSGMATADQLNKMGHEVVLFERNTRIGGLLRYGIPDFKLEKWVIDRRLEIMSEEGVQFKTHTNVGVDLSVANLKNDFDAIVLCLGSTIPRDLKIPGREAQGVHFAMEFLEQNNKRVAGDSIDSKLEIYARDKNVIVIGGGDTGSDCVGTSNRHGAKSVTQIEILGKPPENRNSDNPWPQWPMILRTSTSHEEGCERQWSILTKEFMMNDKQELTGLKVVEIEWEKDDQGKHQLKELPETEEILPCELALLSVGYLHPQHKGLVEALGLEVDARGNILTENYQSNVANIFAAGDARRGQSLVVWAITEGRQAAKSVHQFLSKHN